MITPVRFRLFSLTILFVIAFGQLVRAAEARRLAGKGFRQELDKPVSVVFTRTDLRRLLEELSTNQNISILLDRRQDSSAEFTIDLKNVSLQAALTEIALKANAKSVAVENVIYFGPALPISRTRTLIELRKNELPAKTLGIEERRRTELQRRHNFGWKDLEPVRDIIQSLTSDYRVKVRNIDLIPHDLWAAATLPEMNLIETLTIVLNQFDLTFQWGDGGSSIELVPIPERIWVERKIRPKQKLAEALTQVQQQFPELEVKASNTDLVVKGLVEECEAVAELLRGGNQNKQTNNQLPQDLRKRKFTFSAPVAVPLSLVMQKLEESDIRFEYDADEFKDHGIDLEQLVDITADNEPADAFFKRLFGPAKIDFQIQQTTVKLAPKKRK